jgi:L-fuconolactonase
MRIDAHQHFWQYRSESPDFMWIGERMSAIRRSFLPEELRPLLQAAGMDGTILVQAAQTEAENQFLLGLAEQSDFVLGVVGWVELCDPNVGRELDRLMQHPKFRGVRRLLQAEPASILEDPAFNRGIVELTRRKLTYDILVYSNQLSQVIPFAAAHPEQAFVIDHLGKPNILDKVHLPWAAEMRELGRMPHVYCKLSGMVTGADWTHWTPGDLEPYLDTVFDCFPPERLMFGSDWPVSLLAAPYHRVLAIVEEYLDVFGSPCCPQILGDTAARFYRIGAQG